jgi:hypothetical protein
MGSHRSPSVGDVPIHGQKAFRVPLGDRFQPCFECISLARILGSDPFDTPADLAQNKDTDEQFVFWSLVKPRPNPGITSILLPKFAQDVCVQ